MTRILTREVEVKRHTFSKTPVEWIGIGVTRTTDRDRFEAPLTNLGIRFKDATATMKRILDAEPLKNVTHLFSGIIIAAAFAFWVLFRKDKREQAEGRKSRVVPLTQPGRCRGYTKFKRDKTLKHIY